MTHQTILYPYHRVEHGKFRNGSVFECKDVRFKEIGGDYDYLVINCVVKNTSGIG